MFSRRDVLKGMGASIALPFLEVFRQQTAPVRVICIEQVHGAAGSSPYGWQNNLWAPAATGHDFDLTPTSLKPLERFRDHLTIISNCDVPSADPTDAREIGGDHFRSSATYLTQSYPKRTDGADIECGTSMDQLYAQRVGQDTPIPSLQLCIEDINQAGGCLYGYSCAYADSISWASPTKPLPMTRDPRVVFNQIFNVIGAARDPQAHDRIEEDRSILDWLLESTRRLDRSLGIADRIRLADYLENVREIERRLQAIEHRNRSGDPRELPTAPDGVPDSFADHVRLMFDLQMLAFRSDVTRVVSFKLARDGSNRVYPESGSTSPFHPLSHHGEQPARIRELAKVNAYHVGMLGHLLHALQDTPDGDGTMLDNALVVYGSPMGNPNQHNHKRVPFLLAGHAGGRIKGGTHVRAANGTPLSNVMLSLLHTLGLDDLSHFGDSEKAFAWT